MPIAYPGRLQVRARHASRGFGFEQAIYEELYDHRIVGPQRTPGPTLNIAEFHAVRATNDRVYAQISHAAMGPCCRLLSRRPDISESPASMIMRKRIRESLSSRFHKELCRGDAIRAGPWRQPAGDNTAIAERPDGRAKNLGHARVSWVMNRGIASARRMTVCGRRLKPPKPEPHAGPRPVARPPAARPVKSRLTPPARFPHNLPIGR